jgi:branched-chain amino acid transport system ATP-binding protein
VDLIHLRDEYAANLSGGQKKLLELARTLMCDPEMILLDEPGAGVNRVLMRKLVENIETLRRDLGITFFVIEHDMDLVTRSQPGDSHEPGGTAGRSLPGRDQA